MNAGSPSFPSLAAPPQSSRTLGVWARAAIGLAILCLNGLMVPAASAQEGTVKGRAIDAASGRPIETMEVRLVGKDAQLLRITDGEGAFLFPRVPAGVYELILNHVAYGTRTDTLEVVGGRLTDLELRVAMQPIELKPLEVTVPLDVRVRYRAVTAKMLGFYERMEKGLGQFITREDIELRQPVRITYIIGEIPGVRLVRTAEGGVNMAPIFRRNVRFTSLGGLEACWPAVYVDGMRVDVHAGFTSGGKSGPTFLDEFIIPSEVEAIEAYDGPAVLPPEFGGYDARCGVIIIWTR